MINLDKKHPPSFKHSSLSSRKGKEVRIPSLFYPPLQQLPWLLKETVARASLISLSIMFLTQELAESLKKKAALAVQEKQQGKIGQHI